MTRFIKTWILLGFAPLVLADQNDNKLSKDLPAVASNAFVDVIIQFQPATSKQLQDHLSQLENLLTQFGQGNQQQQGQNGQKKLNTISALHMRVPAFIIPYLKANPFIKYISP